MRILTAIVILLAGCASTGGDIQGARDSWNGAAYDDVVSRWGATHRHQTFPDGAQVYTWESESKRGPSPGYSSVAALGRSSVGALPQQMVRCNRTLIFRYGRVVEQTWQGEPEFCERFRR